MRHFAAVLAVAASLAVAGCVIRSDVEEAVGTTNDFRQLADRFPGATILGEAEFASAIVGRQFRYRLSNDLIMERPAEHFYENGRYSVGHRAISHGTYSIVGGIVSIDCPGCRYPFAGLSNRRIFFRHQGRLFMANADDNGGVVELIPAP